MVAEEVEKLLNAAKNGDLTVLNSVKVTDVIEDDHGANCIHYAARGGSLEALQYLVESKSLDPTKRNNVGATPLHDAAATGNLEALKWLLNRADTKVDDQDGTGATVTHLSARYGHTQTLTWLLDETNCDILKKSASGALPIHSAAEGGHLECVKLLVEEAPRSVNMQMNNGATPVYLACQSGHLGVAQYLSQKNGTPKIHTFDGMSSLHAAAQMNQLPIVKWLIKDQGLNPNERDFDGATPLHYAASQGHKDIVQWLMKEGGARIILDNLGGSPLHNAAELNQNQIILTLLENGCNPEITDNEGLTAEELAVKCGNTTAAAILRGEITSLPPYPPTSSTAVGATSTLPSASVHQIPPLTSVLPPSPTPPPPPPPPPLVPSSVQTPSEQPRKPVASITASHSRAAVTTVLADHPSFGGSAEGDSTNRSYSLISVVAEVHNNSQGASQGHLCSSRETGEQEYVYESECPQNCAHTPSPVAAVKSTPTASNLSSDHHFPTDSSAAFDISSGATRSKTLASTKNWQTAAQGASDMASKPSEETNGMSNGEESKEPAKSVIKITSNNVTIISTGREGRMASKIVTTPLRKNSDEYLGSGAMVTARKKDSEFISALTQKLQGSGSSSSSSPNNSPGSTLNRMSSNLSRSSVAPTPAWQHQQKQVEEALLKRQQIPEKTSKPILPPSPLVNGHANNSHEALVNGGLEEDLSPLPPPPPPPPPPPGPESNSSSSRKIVIADASYSSSRPKLLDSYSSVPNGSPSPTSPGRISFTPHQQKHDLMAALHAVVASGAPSALLRKTKGPPTGGVMEVFSSKRASVRTSPARPESSTEPEVPISSGPEKQNSPNPPGEGFDPKTFLDQVPKVNSSGNQIPEWKRLMVAKTVAQKAEEEYLEKKRVEEYEARFKNMPAWKRALLEKKEGSSK